MLLHVSLATTNGKVNKSLNEPNFWLKQERGNQKCFSFCLSEIQLFPSLLSGRYGNQ